MLLFCQSLSILAKLFTCFCDLETNIVAVERIQEYTDCPQEVSLKAWV